MEEPPPSTHEPRRSPHGKRGLLAALLAEATPLDLRILGRMLLHAAAVGAGAGLMACLFYYALEVSEHFVLQRLAGYVTLRASGELHERPAIDVPFRPWLLLFLPAVGAYFGSLLVRKVSPECEGGGGNAAIEAFHQRKSEIRRRVIWVKPLATLLTLCTGGSGGREGPTMQMGAAIGSTVARYLRLSERERRILLVAGIAAGTSAIFRTPLGAALLAVEILYRDDFEADALIPAVLASVVAYSVFISVFGDATLFTTEAHYPFLPAHLPWYALLALLLSALGVGYLYIQETVERVSAALPAWSRSATNGLGVGVLATFVVLTVTGEQGLGLLGGGYGAAQVAITGAAWLPNDMRSVQLLLLICVAKMLVTSFTLGTGGSAGAFGPSLTIGALFGGAFGRLLQLTLDSPTIMPGAFALVGMGAFFGGIAHTPLGALVMVCELAGSYDLLVPLMLAEGIAFVLLRHKSLYRAQVPNQNASPAHPARVLDVLRGVRVRDVIVGDRPYTRFLPGTPAPEIMRAVSETTWQDVFPVLADDGRLLGMITPELLRVLAAERELEPWLLAVDAMQEAVSVHPDDDLRVASERMLTHHLRELLVVDDEQRIVGFLDEAEINQRYLSATPAPDAPPSRSSGPGP